MKYLLLVMTGRWDTSDENKVPRGEYIFAGFAIGMALLFLGLVLSSLNIWWFLLVPLGVMLMAVALYRIVKGAPL